MIQFRMTPEAYLQFDFEQRVICNTMSAIKVSFLNKKKQERQRKISLCCIGLHKESARKIITQPDQFELSLITLS